MHVEILISVCLCWQCIFAGDVQAESYWPRMNQQGYYLALSKRLSLMFLVSMTLSVIYINFLNKRD